jgi:hypothetical protein
MLVLQSVLLAHFSNKMVKTWYMFINFMLQYGRVAQGFGRANRNKMHI